MSKKPLKASVPEHLVGIGLLVPHDDEFWGLYPTLAATLWPKVDEGRLTRMAGWLALKLEAGVITVKVVCPTEKLETQIRVLALCSLWSEVDTAIRTRTCVWVQTWSERKKQEAALDKAIDAVIES
jgi:hypothetical protein